MMGFGAKNYFNTLAEAREVVGRFNGHDRLLIVDEAQHLIQRNRRNNITGEAFNWLVDVAEDYAFPVVFCGDLTLANFVNNVPRMSSRMRRPIVLKHVSKSDVQAITAGTGFDSPECLQALNVIARMTGGLRNVENVIRIGIAFAGNDRPNAEHLKAAILDMKLDVRGAML